ncbi:ferredoxin [Catenulispora subtropica]|uniref:Ferredoxin n=1 Tax=Catenulispora subtropica TaxID=450798 RepID=A0ABP5DRK2_9ACTN
MLEDDGYWDPTPLVPDSTGAEYLQGYRLPSPDKYLRGRWEDRNWLNVPGPFYGANTDTCATGPTVAPHNILLDDDYQEFVFRQPRNERETLLVLGAAYSDPLSGYASDGDQHWTVDTVRAWWRERARVSEWIVRSGDTDGTYSEYSRFLDEGLEGYLRGYLFWLEERRAPDPRDNLPDL